MANIFDFRDSSAGVFANVNFLLVENTSYWAANNLFYGSGGVSGTFTYFDEALGRNVTSPTGMGTSGVIGFGEPIDVFFRDMPGVEVPASFDASKDFTGIIGGPEGTNQGLITGYFRLFGIEMPVLTWDNTASGVTSGAASAEFAANLAASAADHLAQLQAVLATTVRNGIDMVTWDSSVTAPEYVMHFTPDANTALTYGDLLEILQDEFGRTYLSAKFDATNGLGNLFGPDETVDIILTGFNDTVGYSAFFPGEANFFAAGTVNIDAGAGNDSVSLLNWQPEIGPERLNIDGGSGSDTIEVGAWYDTQINGGGGSDRIDLTIGGSDAQASHTLNGGAGDDVIFGSLQGAHRMTGGLGKDSLYGGDWTDSMAGGGGNDTLLGYFGNDVLDGNAGNDSLTAGHGDDTLFGGAGNDQLYGDDGLAFSRRGNDLIEGGTGRDSIWGETGADTLNGGADNDRISGGSGIDTFVFGARAGRDVIEDYQRGEVIRIDRSYWTGTVEDFVSANVFLNGSGVLTIRLSDVDRVQVFSTRALDPDDFLDAINFF